MNPTARIRQLHRWLSMAFTLSAFAVTVVVLTQESPAAAVYLSPLLPLAVLLLTGLYLFALPYAARWRNGRRPARGG